jgi:hypothetical protein
MSTPRANSPAPLVVAWLATGAAAGFGVATRLVGRATFDPIVALTSASVIGLAWYTYFTRKGIVDAGARDDARTDERRKSVATALLAELSSTVGRVRNLALQGPGAGNNVDFVETPTLDHACELPELFSSTTLLILIEARRRLGDVQLYLAEHEKGLRLGLTATTPNAIQIAQSNARQHAKSVKIRARWAHNKLVDLVSALQLEGGSMPAASEPPVADPSDVPLLPDPFERPP